MCHNSEDNISFTNIHLTVMFSDSNNMLVLPQLVPLPLINNYTITVYQCATNRRQYLNFIRTRTRRRSRHVQAKIVY